jgi:transposase InsO family protein
MQVYGSILPGAAAIARLLPEKASEVKRGPPRPLSKEARGRLAKIRWYEEHGRRVRLTCRHFGISSSTFYKWLRRYQRLGPVGLEERSRRPRRVRQPSWGHELVQAVQRLRERHPRWGKDKLAPLLRVAGWECSTSKVGRIIAALKKQGRLVEAPLGDPWRVSRPHKRPHAVRKPRDYSVRAPGDLVQLDTTDIRPFPGVIRKHFTARDVVSRWDVVGVYFQATARTAAEFLEALIARAPFTVRAIQIDGGSEFKAEFELLCQQRGIRLFVLPPRSPKLNGSVERAQRTHKEEFYDFIDWPGSIAELRRKLRRQETVYNTIRPHQSLGYLTPLAFLQRHYKQKTDHDPLAAARLPFYTRHLSTERRPV